MTHVYDMCDMSSLWLHAIHSRLWGGAFGNYATAFLPIKAGFMPNDLDPAYV
jgi:hypothetical protein